MRTASDPAILGDDLLHMSISYRQIPVLQQIRYALCFNLLMKRGSKQTSGLITLQDEPNILPVLPLAYYHAYQPQGNKTKLDAVAQPDDSYHMKICDDTWVPLPSYITSTQIAGTHGYRAEASEFLDHMLTRSVHIKTDLFCSIENPPAGTAEPARLLLVGFCHCQTSTNVVCHTRVRGGHQCGFECSIRWVEAA